MEKVWRQKRKGRENGGEYFMELLRTNTEEKISLRGFSTTINTTQMK